MMVWLLDITRLPGSTDRLLPSLQVSFAKMLLHAAQIWLFYMAIEPLVRRRWPGRMISWTRLLAGRWRDPLVGRDVLIGLAAGVIASVLLSIVVSVLCRGLGVANTIPDTEILGMMGGVRPVLGQFFNILFGSIYIAIFMTVATLLIQIVVRKIWIAAPLLWLMISIMVVTDSPGWNPAQAVGISAMISVFLFVTIHFGMLAGPATIFSVFMMGQVSHRPDVSSWVGLPDAMTFAMLLTLALIAFYLSLAGRSVVKGELLGD